jgi:uncharacterized protein
MNSGNSVAKKLVEKLMQWFKAVKPLVMVLFSGGVDSSVILATACLSIGCENVLAVTVTSPIRFPEDLEWAKKIASMLGVKHVIVETNELSIKEFVSNPPNRCYICKKHLAEKVIELVKKFNVETIVDGTNADDLKSYRPGIKAFREIGVRSPLAELGIGKEEVRVIAKALNLPNWDRPPMTCLVTRIPYGELITIEKLRRIAKAEEIIKSLTGVKLVRVRDHNYIARIEVYPKERKKFFDEKLMDRIAYELKNLGYKYVTLDLQGYRSGSLDELLKENRQNST